jgi:tetratricopeptide (TPR) repeat protein
LRNEATALTGGNAKAMLEEGRTKRHHAARRLTRRPGRSAAAAMEPSSPCEHATAPCARHLSIETMTHLMAAAAAAEPNELAAFHHLLDVCCTCRQVYEQLEARGRELIHWDLVRVLPEADAAPGLWARIEELPFRRQLEAVRTEPCFHAWGFALHLVRLSAIAVTEQPEQAARLANLALTATDALDLSYDEDWIADLEALGHAQLADARREMGELAGANDAIHLALWRWMDGTEGAAIEAEVLTREALLRRDEKRLEEAARLLARVHEIATEPNPTEEVAYDPHRGGMALVHRAWCLYHMGLPGEALATLERAAALLVAGRDPGLALRAGRAHCLLRLGRLEDAAIGLDEADESARLHGDGAVQLRVTLARARIAKEPAEAEAMLRAAAQGFLELDLGLDAALAFLDLADHLLQKADLTAIPPLAAELLPAFSSPEIRRDEFATLLLFQSACEECQAGRLTSGLITQLAALLERGRRPSLAWWSIRGTELSEAPRP